MIVGCLDKYRQVNSTTEVYFRAVSEDYQPLRRASGRNATRPHCVLLHCVKGNPTLFQCRNDHDVIAAH